MSTQAGIAAQELTISAGELTLQGLLRRPEQERGIVLFAHGSGSSRFSPRNTFVANVLGDAGISTLLFDLLSAEEERIDAVTAELRFDIPLLTERLIAATRWTLEQPDFGKLAIGYFGSSTGAAAALAAAACVPEVAAVVSRGGRPDLAGQALNKVRAATLLIVGGDDRQVLALNEAALAQLECESKIEIVPGATHLFTEPGTLEQVASLAAAWFASHLGTNLPKAAPRRSHVMT
jgi:dienelactone hydrolase